MADQQLWEPQLCGYVFDPLEGDADGEVNSATVFEDIPADLEV